MMQRLFRGGPTDAAPSPSTAASATGPARPIRFLHADEHGKIVMDPEAVALLQLVKEPIGIVSVCGRARQGKSFILNQLLGRSSGFQVASTHRPCTKGLWLWSAPLKRTALDGTEYNLILLDSEGIDAYDQTMGGIDEAALDRLSLVSEMTKHIRVTASGGRTTASELGQFSPIFVWLLRDFYLDLAKEDRRITPRDYLELALRPVQGGGKDLSAKNEIRESIRALFPDRECFTLVRPLNSERELQRLDQIPLEKMRPEFRSGLDALTRFVFERTRKNQLGATVLNGPMLAGITQSFLDAINNGAVPIITSSWQSVEEAECRRGFDAAAEVYMASFDHSKPPEEVALREAHEDAIQKAMAEFNSSAVGTGSIRQKYEKLLQSSFRKIFEDYKRNAYMEAELQCVNAIQNMEKKLRAACHASDASFDHVIKVLDGLVAEYEASCHGPGKWRKLSTFIRQSFEGPISDLAKRQIDQIKSEKSSLSLKCRSIEDRIGLLSKQLEASEKQKSEYVKRYEDAINDMKKLSDDYTSRINNLQDKSNSLEGNGFCEAGILEWKRKYEQVLSNHKRCKEQAGAEIAVLKSRYSAANARLDAAREQAKSAQEEAEEWKRRLNLAATETKAALEKSAVVQERSNKNMEAREDALRAEFSNTLSEKDDELRDKATKLEHAEQGLTTLSLELKAAESKLKSYDIEVSGLNIQINELRLQLDATNKTAQSYEKEAIIREQQKIHLEQKYCSEFARFDEVQERCITAEKEAKRATEVADKARAEAAAAQKEKSEAQRLAMERLANIERAERQIENLERQRMDLVNEVDRLRSSEMEANSKVSMLKVRVEEREKEIESLMKSNNEQRASTVQVLESLLETERAARGEANRQAEALSVQLQATQGKLDLMQQELTSVRLTESALDGKLKTASHGKRSRTDDYEMGTESVHDADFSDRIIRSNKKARNTSSPLQPTASPGDDGSVRADDGDDSQKDTEDYTKFTVQKLKQELTRHDFGGEVLKLRNPSKKELLALYERCVLQKA
ncbi:Guanylate-binding protein 3-like protein [Drosera capensis]